MSWCLVIFGALSLAELPCKVHERVGLALIGAGVALYAARGFGGW